MKKNIILGTILGIIMPIVGIFAGLQISTTLGNVLAFPVIMLAYITKTPFGMWHPSMLLLAILLSIIEWIILITLIDNLRNRF